MLESKSRAIFAQLGQEPNKYNQTEKKLIHYILKELNQAAQDTIQSMAKKTGVSTASISRFVKKIGFESYRDFSVALASYQQSKPPVDLFGEITDDDNTKAIRQKVFSGAQNALTMTSDALSSSTLDKALEWLISAKRVGFFGIGGSSIVAFNAYHKFLRTPIDVISHPDYDIQLMQAVKLTPQDTAVVISHSGRNDDTLFLAQKLKEHHVPFIAITSFSDSPLAKMADIVLLSLAEEVNYRSESMSSLIAQLTIVDTLFTLTGSKLPKATQTVVDTMRDVIEGTRRH
ncbi:MurR/RpiR family transcriptional regulator [Fructobacillus fructosus]|uniref:MurR/RpiR family n=1 Tax=Fructobacillus fructosus TaxID=1631 RepID=A0ABN9YRR0_9LACO|nr:MurR/RpiR family transcriptional regulator [Fructobacillus fructosus]MBD9365014.1 MurR/RpiR family transcriptional regulator [Leuconostoc mesenteroides]KRN52596.1 transcription regulator [Fructobacillus fructosus KCTC 3544]MBC9118537.1 MurR/RpiR family transcriptional regulator [Fructobacillus fructosus]MCK8638431.1 MurR/RpiR family transcriptional regulator [Fructobacillus fructosus]CAK1223017.1 DNA-binding transcriptional regulator [Fructobacillus fructosus]